MKKKPIIGVMGAIGSGKSFVASLFARHGCAVIDADAIVSKLYSTGEFVNTHLVPIFGEKVIDSDGNVDRKFISGIVFDDAEKLKQLNAAVHPAVIDKMQSQLNEYLAADDVKAVVLDVPLLVETGYHKECDFLVFVECDEKICIERAAKRSKISKKSLEKRQKSQILLDNKRNIANYIVYNNAETSVVEWQVTNVISDIFRSFCGK